METKARTRVVLRVNEKKRRHCDVTAGPSAGEVSAVPTLAPYDHLPVQNSNVLKTSNSQHPLPPPSNGSSSSTDTSSSHSEEEVEKQLLHVLYSTPLHPPSPARTDADLKPSSFSLSSSSSSLSSLGGAVEHTPVIKLTTGSSHMTHCCDNSPTATRTSKDDSKSSTFGNNAIPTPHARKQKVKRARMRNSKVYPEPQQSGGSHPQTLLPSATWSPPHTHSSSLNTSLSSGIHSCSLSLPPLRSEQQRRGGRKPSVHVNWGSSGVEGLCSCLPDQLLKVFVGTWNMQSIKVS